MLEMLNQYFGRSAHPCRTKLPQRLCTRRATSGRGVKSRPAVDHQGSNVYSRYCAAFVSNQVDSCKMAAMPIRLMVVGFIALLLSAREAAGASLGIAAASDLQPVLPELVKAFEAESGHSVRITFGSSGTFHAQIANGAPFDLFLSADVDYPRTLARDGKADATSLRTYAAGQLVLWSRLDSGVDIQRGLAVLADPPVTRVAIANPAHAPYGRAAMAALEAVGLTARVRPKLVLGENASQTAQFAQSGNAQVGLLPLALALAPAMMSAGRYVAVPAQLHPPILQAAIIVSASRNKAAAEEFLRFFTRDSTVARLAAAGFLRP